MDNAAKAYLAVAGLICLVLMPLGPPQPEDLLLRHLRRVETRLEESATATDARAGVLRYLERHGSAISRIQTQLASYPAERSVGAFVKLESRIAELEILVSENPQLAAELGDLLWDVLP
jgi:hypothetical protein